MTNRLAAPFILLSSSVTDHNHNNGRLYGRHHRGILASTPGGIGAGRTYT
jgi:hypothetical protein